VNTDVYERWLIVAGFEGYYEVSNFGRVRSLARRDCIGRQNAGRILQGNLNSHGYLQVTLCKDRKNFIFPIHTLVAKAFIGKRPAGKQLDHIDGNKINNCVWNLRYLSPVENIRSGIFLGLHKPRKLDYETSVEIRRLSIEGMSYADIARKFNITRQYARRVALGRAWHENPRKG
jgi:hypothetical protein